MSLKPRIRRYQSMASSKFGTPMPIWLNASIRGSFVVCGRSVKPLLSAQDIVDTTWQDFTDDARVAREAAPSVNLAADK